MDVDLIFFFLIVVLVWQGNLLIDHILNKRYSWIENQKKRLILEIGICTIFTSAILFLMFYTTQQVQFNDGKIMNKRLRGLFPVSLALTFIFITIHISKQFYTALQNSLLEVEKYKTVSASAQLENLKNQLNPHFLFNNFSVLTSLVHTNQNKAADFINELAKVYRYVLETKNEELVSLEEELDFIDHYIYLQKIRFEDSILFEIKIDESKKTAYLLPMCLQMLVENTIQHNESSKSNPLKVFIYTQNNSLIIENPILPRSNVTESTKTGLKNIEKRYSFFTDEKVIVYNNGEIFKVILPLIENR